MKLLNIACAGFLCLAVVVTSCMKGTEPQEALSMEQKLEKVLRLKGDEQRVAFNLLTPEEKREVWSMHIEKYVRDKDFRQNQKELINELVHANRSNFYQGDNDAKENALQIFRYSWIERAKTTFKADEIYDIAFTLNTVMEDVGYYSNYSTIPGNSLIIRNQTAPDRSPYNNEALPDCKCSVGSSFTCPKLTFTWDSGDEKLVTNVSYNPCSYNSSALCDVDGGCGFMGWSACDGNKCG